MVWNYRIVKSTLEGEDTYSMREVYYNEEGGVEFITMDPVTICGDDVEDIKSVLDMMAEGLSKPVLLTHSLNDSNEMRMPNQW